MNNDYASNRTQDINSGDDYETANYRNHRTPQPRKSKNRRSSQGFSSPPQPRRNSMGARTQHDYIDDEALQGNIRHLEQGLSDRKIAKQSRREIEQMDRQIRELEQVKVQRKLQRKQGRNSGINDGLQFEGTRNMTSHYINKDKKTDYFDKRLQEMEKKHEQDLENFSEQRKQDHMNGRIQHLDDQQETRRYNYKQSQNNAARAHRVRQLDDEHEAKAQYKKNRREKAHYENKLRDMEQRWTEQQRSDKERQQAGFYRDKIREMEGRHQQQKRHERQRRDQANYQYQLQMLENKRRNHALSEQEKDDINFFEQKVKDLEREDRNHKKQLQDQMQKDIFEKKIRQLGEEADDFPPYYGDSYNASARSPHNRSVRSGKSQTLRDFSESDDDSVDQQIGALQERQRAAMRGQGSKYDYSETDQSSDRRSGVSKQQSRSHHSNDVDAVSDNQDMTYCVYGLIIFGVLLELFAVGLCIFLRFYFVEELCETPSNRIIFLVFLSFTILAVAADLLSYSPSWQYSRIAFHVVALTGFCLSGIFTSFALKDIDRITLTPQEDATHGLSFWVFITAILIRTILFTVQFWLNLQRTMKYRDLLQI